MHALALVALVAVVWFPSVHPQTVDHDTPWLVVDNPMLNQGSSAQVIPIFTDLSPGTRLTLGAEYLPVRDVSVLVDFALFGEEWSGHHFVNLVWYALGCVLWLWLCRRLLPTPQIAWLAAALYAVHPVHVESVSWLASRKDVLSLSLFLGSMVGWLQRRRGLSWLLFAMAYWSKNTAITLPAILMMWSVLVERADVRRVRWWVQWVPHGVIALLGLAVTMQVADLVSMIAAHRADTPWQGLCIGAQILWKYLSHLMIPMHLSVLYPVPATDHRAWLGLVSLAMLVGVMVRCWRRHPAISMGVAWFGITLLPVSQLIPIQNLMADRYLLLPSAGFLVAAMAMLSTRLPVRVCSGLGVVGVVWFGSLTVQRCWVWTDSRLLWADAVTKHPGDDRGWSALAGAQLAAGDPELAAQTLQAGLTARPDSALLVQSLGLLQVEQGNAEAEQTLRHALSLDPSRRKAANALAVLLQRTGRVDESIAVAEQLVSIHPQYAVGWNTLTGACIDARDLDCAAHAVEQALRIAPMNASVWANRGSVAYLQGDLQQARHSWEEALRWDPGQEYARQGLEHLRAP